MAGVHPVINTLPNQPCTGLAESDADIPLRLVNGVYQKTVDNSRVDAKLIAVQRADSGKTPNRCTIEYQGLLEFEIEDGVTLDNAVINRGVLGASNGGIKPHAYTSTYNENLQGRIKEFSNATGNKWIRVLMPSP